MEQVISRDGTPIAYWRSGSGPPLVLVHGATADHQRWATVLPQLEPHFTLFAVDRRGRGESGDGPEYSVQREAEDVADVVEAVATELKQPVALLGHSFGGLVSLEAALLTPKLERLIVYEPPMPPAQPSTPAEIIDRMQAKVDAGENEAALEIMFREVVRMPEEELAFYRQLPAWPVRITLAPTLPRELRQQSAYEFEPARFVGLATPALLLEGGESPYYIRRIGEMLVAALPDARVRLLDGQQHVAMDTAPELFAAEVRQFLQ